MPFTDGKKYCDDCGREMKPLSQSFYCPNDCDRKPQHVDPEKTEKIAVSMCPKCSSPDVIPQGGFMGYMYHKCIDCLHVF